MSKRTLSTAELEKHLSEQLGSLQRSARLFDYGYFVEARRMAVTLRVILHSGRSPSLLKRLNRTTIDFVDSAPPFDPANLLPFHGLVSIRFANDEVSYSAKLDLGEPMKFTPFSSWWEGIVFGHGPNWKMSRADVVLTAADKDGGAHVDGALPADYAALRHENSLGWMTERGSTLAGEPVYVAIRQIAHEVLKTLIPGYSMTAVEVSAERRPSEISGGKLRFFPHEKKFFKNDMKAELTPKQMYLTEIAVDSISTGSVRMVVNSNVSAPISSAGVYIIPVEAGTNPDSGVFGEYTDAVVDRVSIKKIAT